MAKQNANYDTKPGASATGTPPRRAFLAAAAALASGTLLALGAAVALGITSLAPNLAPSGQAKADNNSQLARGKYLVTLAGCNDCHTPGYFFGKPDMGRFLGGSEVGFEIPGLGVFHGPNLTPDRASGLGEWKVAEIVTAIQQGRRPDGRELAPIMPWHAFAHMTKEDATAIAVFLKSLPAVANKVPGPFGPTETPSSFVMKIVPPQKAASR